MMIARVLVFVTLLILSPLASSALSEDCREVALGPIIGINYPTIRCRFSWSASDETLYNVGYHSTSAFGPRGVLPGLDVFDAQSMSFERHDMYLGWSVPGTYFGEGEGGLFFVSVVFGRYEFSWHPQSLVYDDTNGISLP